MKGQKNAILIRPESLKSIRSNDFLTKAYFFKQLLTYIAEFAKALQANIRPNLCQRVQFCRRIVK